jgi:hypothetical protein
MGLIALALTLAGPALAPAAEVKPFDAKAFEAAQAAGEGVVVDIHATW